MTNACNFEPIFGDPFVGLYGGKRTFLAFDIEGATAIFDGGERSIAVLCVNLDEGAAFIVCSLHEAREVFGTPTEDRYATLANDILKAGPGTT